MAGGHSIFLAAGTSQSQQLAKHCLAITNRSHQQLKLLLCMVTDGQ